MKTFHKNISLPCQIPSFIISELFTELKTFLLSTLTNEDHFPFSIFPVSNEKDWHLEMAYLENFTTRINDIKQFAILTGESHLLSLLPALANHCSTVILNDIHPYIHIHLSFMLNLLSKCSSPEEFINKYASQHPLLEKFTPLPETKLEDAVNILVRSLRATLIDSFLADQGQLGKFFFLSTPERYQACRQAKKKLEFLFSSINYSEKVRMATFLEKIETNGQIVLFNLSNVHDYCQLQVSFKKLCSYPFVYYSYPSQQYEHPVLCPVRLTPNDDYFPHRTLFP
jgi:hypothetical protein